jgi:SH3 domain-containing YSC84-like protein 1
MAMAEKRRAGPNRTASRADPAAVLHYLEPGAVPHVRVGKTREEMTMATTHIGNRRGLAGPLVMTAAFAALGLVGLSMARPVAASEDAKFNVTADAREEVQDATAAFQRVIAARPIPQALLDKAEAVAVFSNLVKAAFIVGGTGGDGVFMRKTATGWSAPAFVNLAGASVGAQIGGEKSDAVFFFMDQRSIDALAGGRLEFGTAINAVAGPASARAETLSTSTVKGVFVYSTHEGLFAGASANGTTIQFDDEENKAVYGADASNLSTGTVDTPKGLEGLAQALKAAVKPASE